MYCTSFFEEPIFFPKIQLYHTHANPHRPVNINIDLFAAHGFAYIFLLHFFICITIYKFLESQFLWMSQTHSFTERLAF